MGIKLKRRLLKRGCATWWLCFFSAMAIIAAGLASLPYRLTHAADDVTAVLKVGSSETVEKTVVPKGGCSDAFNLESEARTSSPYGYRLTAYASNASGLSVEKVESGSTTVVSTSSSSSTMIITTVAANTTIDSNKTSYKICATSGISDGDYTIYLNYALSENKPSVTVSTDALPDGKVASTYSATLAAGGTALINGQYRSWSIDSGTLPAGLSLSPSSGVISGTPTAEGTSNFTVKVGLYAADGTALASATKNLSIYVASQYNKYYLGDGDWDNDWLDLTNATVVKVGYDSVPDIGDMMDSFTVYYNPSGIPNNGVEVDAIGSAGGRNSITISCVDDMGGRTTILEYRGDGDVVTDSTPFDLTGCLSPSYLYGVWSSSTAIPDDDYQYLMGIYLETDV